MVLYVNDVNFMVVLNVSKEKFKTIDLLYTKFFFNSIH